MCVKIAFITNVIIIIKNDRNIYKYKKVLIVIGNILVMLLSREMVKLKKNMLGLFKIHELDKNKCEQRQVEEFNVTFSIAF